MKHGIRMLLPAVVLAVLCACAGEKVPTDLGAGGEPMDIMTFSFVHTESAMDACFSLELTREENGVRVHAEELFSGGHIADSVVESGVLERVEEWAGTYDLGQWDGFDKNDRHASDGSTFTLHITRTDGSTVSAHGNNRFPEGYSEFYSEIRGLYHELMEQYGN